MPRPKSRRQWLAQGLSVLIILVGLLSENGEVRRAFLSYISGGGGAVATLIIVVALVVLFAMSAVRVVREYERGVIFRLGRLIGAKGPGLFFLIPIVDKMVKVSLRVITMDIPPQEVITKDNVTCQVNAVLFFRVVDPNKAVNEVENFLLATNQIAQTTLRSVLGQVELDELLAEREKLNKQLQAIIDEHTDPWGIKVRAVEIKDVRLPQDMQRTIGRQAEAERERRSKVINAEGELQAAEKLQQAALILQKQPAAIQLRYLQTLLDISSDRSSTIVFPLPIDMISTWLKGGDHGAKADD